MYTANEPTVDCTVLKCVSVSVVITVHIFSPQRLFNFMSAKVRRRVDDLYPLRHPKHRDVRVGNRVIYSWSISLESVHC